MLNPWTTGDEIRLLVSGEEYFPEVLRTLKEAQEIIQVEVFTLEADRVGQSFIHALKESSVRGVRVQMIIDGLGSRSFPLQELNELRKAGVEVEIYRPLLWGRPFQFFFRRMHRKTIAIDRRIAFVGGLNIAADYFESYPEGGRVDIALRIEGPQVSFISSQMEMLWVRTKRKWSRLISLQALLIKSKLHGKDSAIGVGPRICYRMRDSHFSPHGIEKAYRKAIQSARNHILIANAYFYPPLRMLRELTRAAQRGVKVQLLLQGRPDIPISKAAEKFLYAKLLKEKVEIFEYEALYFHAKAAVIDDHWMTVGSSNLDPWSLFTNLEGNLIVEGSPVAHELQNILQKMMKESCRQISESDLLKASLFDKFYGWLAYLSAQIAYYLVRVF